MSDGSMDWCALDVTPKTWYVNIINHVGSCYQSSVCEDHGAIQN